MPRSSYRTEVLARPEQKAVFAAARNYTIGKSKRGLPVTAEKSTGEEWQNTAWDFYDTIGEYRYAVDWVGNLLSRATLFVTENGQPSTNATAIETMASLFGGEDGQAEMLRSLGIHYTVAGEAYVCGVDTDDEDDWHVVASTEIKKSGDNHFSVKDLGLDLTDGDLVMRLWRAHPRKPWKANSPSRAALPILAELEKLTMHVAAQLDSRLAGAGLLLIPSEMSFPVMPMSSSKQSITGDEDTVGAAPSGAQGFVDMLIEVMSTAIGNRQDASALVPIVLQVAGEYLEKVQHLKFWTDLDEKAIELRNEAIRRLALSMDMPPEILTGIADVNHWGSFQIDESAIKAHSEPLLKAITSALSSGYLRPVLEADGMSPEEAMTFAIGVDTSQLRMRPNRSKEAIELWDRGELSDESLRRENGFDETDMPTDEQKRNWLLRKVASGSASPEQVEAALRLLGIQIVTAAGDDMREAPQPRSLDEHETRTAPNDGEIPDGLVAASEQMVFRALERAGNRLKNRIGSKLPADTPAVALYLRMPDFSSGDIDTLLEDAWSSCTWSDLGVDTHALEAALEAYTRTLLALRKPHDREVLRTYLLELATTPRLVAL